MSQRHLLVNVGTDVLVVDILDGAAGAAGAVALHHEERADAVRCRVPGTGPCALDSETFCVYFNGLELYKIDPLTGMAHLYATVPTCGADGHGKIRLIDNLVYRFAPGEWVQVFLPIFT